MLAVLYPPAASAHAVLLRSSPLDGATVERAPRAVRFVFSDDVRVATGIAAVRNGEGSVLGGKPRMTQDGHVLVIPLRTRLRNGNYTVRWRVTSEDGHTTAGVMVFSLGVGTGRAAPTLSAGGTGPYASDVLGRWLFLYGALAALGICAFRVFVWRPACAGVGLGDERPRALVLASAAAFATAAAGAAVLLHSPQASGTRFGRLYEIGLALALAGAALSVLGLRRLPGAREIGLLAAVGVVLIPPFAGHALDTDQPRGLSPAADVVHIAAAGVWLGGLVALGLVLINGPPQARGAAGKRFSALALASVCAVAATGILRAFDELSAVSQLWNTGYGRALLVKSALLAALVLLGWINRSRLLPSRNLGRLRVSVGLEAMLLAGLVVAVALLTDLPPGRQLARAAAVKQEPLSICDPWLEHFVVLAVCSNTTSPSVSISDERERLFQHERDFRLATLSGAPLAPGDRVVLSGTAPAGSRLTALFVTKSTRAALARFADLGLERGGRATLTVVGSKNYPVFQLTRPDGSLAPATSVVLARDRRQVADVGVKRAGRNAVITFVAPGSVAEVGLVSKETAEELLVEGELEGELLSARTVRTRVGQRIRIQLPIRPEASFVYILPLSRTTTVGPALAEIPG